MSVAAQPSLSLPALWSTVVCPGPTILFPFETEEWGRGKGSDGLISPFHQIKQKLSACIPLARALSHSHPSCKGAWESRWPRSRALEVSAELGKGQYLLYQGCTAEPWPRPGLLIPRPGLFPLDHHLNTEPVRSYSGCDSHSPWRLGCVYRPSSPPWTQSKVGYPSPTTRAWSHSQNLACHWQPRSPP